MKKVRNLNKILSRSKNPELLLYKVVNHPKFKTFLKKSKTNLKTDSFCRVVNHPKTITIKIEGNNF